MTSRMIEPEFSVPSFSFPPEPEEKVASEVETFNDCDTEIRSNVASTTLKTKDISYFVPIAPTHPSRDHFPDECLYIPQRNENQDPSNWLEKQKCFKAILCNARTFN